LSTYQNLSPIPVRWVIFKPSDVTLVQQLTIWTFRVGDWG
jgi:hypothetical protein